MNKNPELAAKIQAERNADGKLSALLRSYTMRNAEEAETYTADQLRGFADEIENAFQALVDANTATRELMAAAVSTGDVEEIVYTNYPNLSLPVEREDRIERRVARLRKLAEQKEAK